MSFDRAMRVATFVLVAAILAVGTACDTDAAVSDLERSADDALDALGTVRDRVEEAAEPMVGAISRRNADL